MSTPEFFTAHVQDGTIKLMLKDAEFLKLCMNTVPASIFPSSILRNICKGVYDFYQFYGHGPGDDFRDFFYTHTRVSDDNKELYETYFNRLKTFEPNKKYIMTRLSDYVQLQTYNQLILKGADLLKKGNVNEFKKIFLESFKNRVDGDELGVNFWDMAHSDFASKDSEKICPTRIPLLDAIIGGYNRSELLLWLAPTNTGKSWALVDGAKAALSYGINAVYYALEMTDKSTGRRLAMAISGMRREDDKQHKVTFFDGIQEDFSARPSLLSDRIGFEKSRNFFKRRGGNLYFKEFKKCTVSKIETHLDLLEARTGLVPDIVFIDYADLMVADRFFNDDLSEINNVYSGLRDMAKERNICVVTASQATREAHGARKVTVKHTAKNIDKVRIADVVISLNQTEEELRNNIMRLFLAKVREGKKGGTIEIKQSFEIGGFCLEDRYLEEDDE